MNTLDVQGFCYQDRHYILPNLTQTLTHCGGWILQRQTLSASTVEFKLEVQLRSIVELYAGLIAQGVELTRGAHATLTDLCTCRQHIGAVADPNQIVSLRIELNFLEDVTLHSLLMTQSAAA